MPRMTFDGSFFHLPSNGVSLHGSSLLSLLLALGHHLQPANANNEEEEPTIRNQKPLLLLENKRASVCLLSK